MEDLSRWPSQPGRGWSSAVAVARARLPSGNNEHVRKGHQTLQTVSSPRHRSTHVPWDQPASTLIPQHRRCQHDGTLPRAVRAPAAPRPLQGAVPQPLQPPEGPCFCTRVLAESSEGSDRGRPRPGQGLPPSQPFTLPSSQPALQEESCSVRAPFK